jgi:hypothetical protein
MSRKLIIVFVAIVGGCGGGGGSAPVLTAEELREGSIGTTLDVLLGAIDLLAMDGRADAYVRGEPVALVATVGEDGVVTIEAIGICRTEATLRLVDDPELGVSVTGTLVTESPDGTVVEGTLERVFVRAAADLPGVGRGVLFTSGNVDLEARAGEDVVATGTAALFGRRALVALSVNGAFTEGELSLGR